jgi:hypothetical protein
MVRHRDLVRAELQRAIGIIPERIAGQTEQTEQKEDSHDERDAKRPRLDPNVDDASAQQADRDIGITTAQQPDPGVNDTTIQQASLDDDSEMANPPSILEPQHIRASVTKQREDFMESRRMARTEFNTEKQRLEDIFKDTSLDRTGGRTLEEWKGYSLVYATSLGRSDSGPELMFWSAMYALAMGFMNGNADAARYVLARAEAELEIWEEE